LAISGLSSSFFVSLWFISKRFDTPCDINQYVFASLHFIIKFYYGRAMRQCQEELIKIPGFQIGIKRWGEPKGTPLLAFHGMLDNAASFDFLAPLLNCHLIAVDSPGCGKSSHYPPGILPQWLEESFLMFHLVNALELKTFDVMGHSRGTVVALTMALASPDRIGKLALLEALGPVTNYSDKTVEYLRKALENYLSYDEKPKVVYKDLDTAIQERMKSGRISHQSAAAITKRGTEKNSDGYVWTYDRRLLSMQPSFPFNDQVNAMFSSLAASTCLIKAKQGLNYPEGIFEHRKSMIKKLEYHEIEGGHHVHMDDSAPVAKILDNFIRN
jgi:pimeloyl-ACP methyl ester carboxylesterase